MKHFFLLILLLFSVYGYNQEICDNGIDDDFDGLIDLNDDECDCIDLSISSLIPNPSFEDTLCCPPSLSMLSCADRWIQASIPTTDYLNLCGVTSSFGFGAPALPLPGEVGDAGYAGFWAYDVAWSEYLGVCLDAPLLAGTNYILNLWVAYGQGPVELNVSIFGANDCSNLPWAGSTCPDGIGTWTLLADNLVTMETDGTWAEATLEFTPDVDIYSIAIGGPCVSGAVIPRPYYYIDELTLLDSSSYYFSEMEIIGGFCSDDLVLVWHSDLEGGTRQWYKEGIAILGETSDSLDVMLYGEGTYTVVSIFDDYCEEYSYTTAVQLSAAFSVEDVCFSDTAHFINESENLELEWLWVFGDGETSDEISPDHVYVLSGPMSPTLVAVSPDPSCNGIAVVDIFVGPKPNAIFEIEADGLFEWASHEVTCMNNLVYFIDESTIGSPSEIVEWYWDFGDGTSSTDPSSSHLYESYGSYDISLTVVSEFGCIDSVLYSELYITAIFPEFTTEDECVFEEYSFVNTSTLIAPEVYDTWEWSFGDGETADTEDASHTYSTPGTYTVELIATTVVGCTDTIESIVNVYPLPVSNFEFIVNGISSEDGGTGGCYTSIVQFNSLATVDAPSEVDTWLWNFGDGGTSALENPTHLYDSEGVYTVELSVVTNFGCQHSFSMDILMTNGLAFLSSDTTICQNGTAVLHASSSDGSFFTYDWSIPDSDNSPDQTIDGLTSNIMVYVTATNAAGCISPTDSIFITLLDPITLEISAYDTICFDETTTHTVISSGGRGDYSFEWTANGELLSATESIINDTPSFITEYCATVSDGCETDPVTICTETYVPQLPVFTADTTEGCEPTEITFTDLTGIDTALNKSTWYINGETLYGNPVSYIFEEAGKYSISIDVLSPEGCTSSNTYSEYITIHPLPEPNFYATPNPTTYFNTTIEVVNINPQLGSSLEWFMPEAVPNYATSDSLVEIYYPELVSGEYMVKLIETTEFGCIDSVSNKIIIYNDQIIYAPNTFTPDGNSYNDTWGISIEGVDIYDFHLMVFNRWGEMVWESYNASGRWDGRYGSEIVQDGVYVWMIHAKDKENDKVYEFKGMVNVLR